MKPVQFIVQKIRYILCVLTQQGHEAENFDAVVASLATDNLYTFAWKAFHCFDRSAIPVQFTVSKCDTVSICVFE